MATRVLFYVQHLMGVGHVFRALRIVRALVRAGFAVDLVHGGETIPHFDAGGARVHFLPPLRAGAVRFNMLEAPDGTIVGQDYRADRRDRLIAIFETCRPDVIVTEAFPFGRRQMRFELLPLLEAAKARANPPVILSSVRDILQENRKPERDLETVDYLEAYFDHVLVHADPSLIRFETTFPHCDRIADKIVYTGIVAPEPPVAGDGAAAGRAPDPFDVVVSVGGGALGRDLLFAAAGAKARSVMRDARWCIVTGVNTAAADVDHLRTLVSADTVLRTFLPDLSGTIARAELSVSRAGYNTLADIYRAGCRAVIAPLHDGEETEQIRRAEHLAAAGLAETVPPDDQTPERLAMAIDRAMARPAPDRSRIDLSGAERSAAIIAAIVARTSLAAFG